MKNLYTKLSILLTALCLCSNLSYSQNTVEASATDNWTGYINWFDLAGNYVSGGSWGVADLKTTLDSAANTITLQPNLNVYDSADTYWTDPVTFLGAKLMEASTFAEPGATFNGTDLTFGGSVSSHTLDTSLYEARYFIKALDPGAGFSDALGGSGTFDLPMSGNFSVTVPGASMPAGLIIQYGFAVYGVNANPVNEAVLGSVVVTASAATSLTQQNYIGISIFPNPASSQLRINTDQFIDHMFVRDLSGKQLLAVGNFSSNHTIDTSMLPSGIYIAEFRNGNKRIFKKFVIK
jgi:hypothetical protein